MLQDLEIERPWRYGGPRPRGGAMLHPGRYAVPRHVPRAVAERAVREGAGRWVTPPKPAASVPPPAGAAGDRRKGGTPEHTSRGRAPANKAALG